MRAMSTTDTSRTLCCASSCGGGVEQALAGLERARTELAPGLIERAIAGGVDGGIGSHF